MSGDLISRSALLKDVNKAFDAFIHDALALIQQLERKLDAAVSDLRKVDLDCEFCLHGNKVYSDCREADFICGECNHKCACALCDDGSCWEWIGPREEPPKDKQK